MLDTNSSLNFDILFLFHSYDLAQADKSLVEYLHSKLRRHKTRFAIGYYTRDILNNAYFEMSQFKDRKLLKNRQISNITDIRGDILNLDWESRAHKLVINLVHVNYVQKHLYDYKNIAGFMCENDAIGSQLKYCNINFVKENLSVSHIDKATVDHITSEAFLLRLITELARVAYLKELYFLKRKVHIFHD